MRKTIDRWCDLHDRIGDKMFTVETRGKRGNGKKFNPDDLDTFSKEDLKMLVYVLEVFYRDWETDRKSVV